MQKKKERDKSEHQVRESKFVNTLAGGGGMRCFGLFRRRPGLFWGFFYVEHSPLICLTVWAKAGVGDEREVGKFADKW